MSKGKISRGLSKRIVMTNSGRMKRKRANRSHLLAKRRPNQKGRLRRSVRINHHDQKAVRLMAHN